jgi:hypothetical protein
MPIATLVPLLVQYGLPFVTQLISMIEAGGTTPVTSAQWAALVALAQQNAQSKMLEVLQAQGIDPTSAQGKAFLALTV